MTDELRGLTMNVLRHADGMDATLGGASSRVTNLTIVGTVDRYERFHPAQLWRCGVFEPTDKAPAAVLRQAGNGAHVQLLEDREAGHWTMAGGNFGYVSDSRFREHFFKPLTVESFHGAVSIHDRVEHGR